VAKEIGMAAIRVGIGGWVFAPWRGTFYPEKLLQAQELAYASRHLTSIEINGTFYGAQKPTSFRRWYGETPEDFVFSLKGPRYATHRRALGEARPSIERFVGSGILELKEKLGPILWQFPPTTRFDADNIAAFLELLPARLDGTALRHVLEVRHASFADAAFIALLRKFGVGVALVDSAAHPLMTDPTADFVYARLRRSAASEPAGYPPEALDAWAGRFRAWSKGGEPDDMPPKHRLPGSRKQGRDCFVYFINGAKERAPAAAQALIERLRA
jgi:uncharacterized protein YecE (DUF72 family)